MRGSWRFGFAFSSAVAAVAGCTGLLGLDDVVYRTVPTDASTPIDAPPIPPSDAAQATDSMRIDDDPDAGTIAPDGASPCVGSHWLCDDFDRDSAPFTLPYWGSTNVTDGSSTSITVPALPTPPSPPNVLMTTGPANGSTDRATLSNKHTGPRGLHCELSMRIDQVGGAGDAIVAAFDITSPSFAYHLHLLAASAGGSYFREYGEVVTNDAALPYTNLGNSGVLTGVWASFSVRVTFGPMARLVIAVNGSDILNKPRSDLSGLGVPEGQELTIGLMPYFGTVNWNVLFDNVFCDEI